MAEKKFFVPELLPILPVRDTVLFPGAMLPLTVGRESSLALVGSLQGEDKLLGVVAQLDPRIEDPAAADLHKVGTLARVHKTVKMPNGNVVVFLEGLQRFQIAELVNLRPFLKAQVKPEPDIIGEVDAELEALQRNAQDLFREVVSHSPQLSDDLQSKAMKSASSPGANRNAERPQASGNFDPRTVEGIGSSRAALENSRAGAGTGQPEPTRVPSARADEGHPKGTGRIGGFNAGNRRASQKSGRSRNAGGSQEGMRA